MVAVGRMKLKWWRDAHGYQIRAKDFIKSRRQCALFVDVGLGKTAPTLTAFSELRESFDVNKCLVIGPLRVARSVWSTEINTWAHLSHLRIQTIVGTEAQRWLALNTDADIHTINRENVQWLEAQYLDNKKLIRPWPWDMVVLDESHSFKSQSSERWKSMRNLRKYITRIVELTGTPIPNGYLDLWAQIYLLDGGKRLYKTEEAFKGRWFEQAGEYGSQIKEFAAPQIQKRIRKIVLTLMTDDYMKLPPVIFNPIRVTLAPKEFNQYKKMERDLLIKVDLKTISAVNAGVLMGKCLQLANGAVFYDRERNWVEFHNEKIKALVELIENTKGPVMIAYAFTHDKARLKIALQKFCGRERTWDVLKGQDSEDRWNAGQIEFLLIHPQSGGEGSNLYKNGCQTIIWFGLTPNLMHWDQLNGRLTGGQRRVGKNIVVHYIVAEGTKDMAMWDLLQVKDGSQTGLKRALAA